ncbi:MAG: ABC transporter ATP-binding protein [Clostridiales bacterium]|nr:ABC transporter ATP-binding protein [Clostridiales bacterium]
MSGITVEGLGKKIKGTVILHDVNMTLEPGRIYGLRGRNGCGKTMIMRSLCGLLIPDKGMVTIDGEVLHRDIKFPRSVGVLIENPSFLPQYTGYRNLRMLARLTGGISDSDIRTALMRTGLDPDDSRTYRKYSLGMKQKLGIANAIMGKPDVIILDEPINALDEQTVENIKTELLKLRDAGKVIVIACHDRDELEFLSDIIYEIKDGTVAGCEVVGE